MPNYTFLTILSLFVVYFLDYILGTKLLWKKKYYLFYLLIVVLHTIVDNYLNGRWGLGSYIVGPYDPTSYSGIKLWFTPLENYFFGFSLISLNIVLYEFFKNKFGKTNLK